MFWLTDALKSSLSFSLYPSPWMILICLIKVDFPDSPKNQKSFLAKKWGNEKLKPNYRFQEVRAWLTSCLHAFAFSGSCWFWRWSCAAPARPPCRSRPSLCACRRRKRPSSSRHQLQLSKKSEANEWRRREEAIRIGSGMPKELQIQSKCRDWQCPESLSKLAIWGARVNCDFDSSPSCCSIFLKAFKIFKVFFAFWTCTRILTFTFYVKITTFLRLKKSLLLKVERQTFVIDDSRNLISKT